MSAQENEGRPRTLEALLAARAMDLPQAPALLAPGKAALSFEGLWQQVAALAAALRACGVRRQDRVAVVLPNGPEMGLSILAAASAAAAAPLNPAYRQREFEFYMGDLGVKALIVLAGWETPARAAARQRGAAIVELSPAADKPAGMVAISAPAGSTARTTAASPEDVAMVLHTSGTTSRPKIVPLTQANLSASAHNIKGALALTPADRCLNIMPLFHIHGIVAGMLSSIAAGASFVCPPSFALGKFFDWMRETSPTWYTAVPTMHQAILSRVEQNPAHAAGARLRFIRSSSSPMPPAVMRRLEKAFDVPLIEAYGMTEASHQIASNPLPPRARKPGSVGLAAGTEIVVLDGDGRPLPPSQVGEVAIRGDNVTSGYENDPAANRSAFVHGWLRTGDLGSIDVEGYLHLAGRVKEVIDRAGEKISPFEIEDTLLGHPAVAQAAAFAVRDAALGEDVGAAVVLKEGCSVTEIDLLDFMDGKLAEFKIPHYLVIVDDIPKGPTGKLQRIGLADRLRITAATDPAS